MAALFICDLGFSIWDSVGIGFSTLDFCLLLFPFYLLLFWPNIPGRHFVLTTDMKNKLTFVIALCVLSLAVLGCSRIWPSSGSNTSSGNSNSEVSAKTGVKECDDFIDMIDRDSKDPNEGFVAKKIREVAIDIAKEAIKTNIEENKGDTEKIAQGCKEAQEKYLKDKAEKEKEKK